MSLTESAVREALDTVVDPELRRSIVALGQVQEIAVADDAVRLLVLTTTPNCPLQAGFDAEIREKLTALGAADIQLEFESMTDQQQQDLRIKLIGDPSSTAGSQASHGHAEGRSIPFSDPAVKTRVLLIASGKGGVGKSSVTTNLAIALAQRGKRVAIIDADVWGFSIPKMIGVKRPPRLIDQMIVPPVANDVAVMSMGFFAEEDQAVIWRGPMLHKALEQFLTDVYWDAPDFLLIDLPPGTGDISISLAQFLPRAEMFVITTPNAASQRVAQRAAAMGHKVNLPVRGVIENMSWFTGDDGKRYELFGAGGGQRLADDIEVPLLGQIPLVQDIREGGDDGRPIVVAEPDSEASAAFAKIAERIDVELAPTRRFNAELRIG